MAQEAEITKVVDHAGRVLPTELATWPGGLPGQIEAALLDAVLSIRAVYGSPTSGVRAAIQRWRAHRQLERVDDLEALEQVDPKDLATILANHQKLSGGNTKAYGVTRAAAALRGVGVTHARELDGENPEHRAAYTSVKGLGPVTWSYLCMLVGEEDVKADVWIRRFVAEALDRPVGSVPSEEARALMVAAAEATGVPATNFDHAVWAAMRDR